MKAKSSKSKVSVKVLVPFLSTYFFLSTLTFELSALGQLAAPNAAGVAMGHLHYHVRDVEANRRFWLTLGGVVPAESPRAVLGPGTEVVRFPGVLVVLTPLASAGGTNGSVVNHVAF